MFEFIFKEEVKNLQSFSKEMKESLTAGQQKGFSFLQWTERQIKNAHSKEREKVEAFGNKLIHLESLKERYESNKLKLENKK